MNFKIKKIHHIKLTVSNLERSAKFYEKLPGFKRVAKYPGFIMFEVGNFYLGLTDHNQHLKAIRFSEKNVGLDHVSFELASHHDLDKALSFLEKEKIKHGKIEKLSNELYILAFRDPDNIQLEFCWREK